MTINAILLEVMDRKCLQNVWNFVKAPTTLKQEAVTLIFVFFY